MRGLILRNNNLQFDQDISRRGFRDLLLNDLDGDGARVVIGGSLVFPLDSLAHGEESKYTVMYKLLESISIRFVGKGGKRKRTKVKPVIFTRLEGLLGGETKTNKGTAL